MSDVWDRQPEETDEQWMAFQQYRDAPIPRSMVNIVNRTNMRFFRTEDVRRWAYDNAWEYRIRAWDEYLDKVMIQERVEATRDRAKEIAAEHAQILATAQALVSKEMTKLLDRSKEEYTGVVKPGDVMSMFEKVVKIQRLVAGEATDRVEIDLSNASDEDLDKMEEILKRNQLTVTGDDDPRH